MNWSSVENLPLKCIRDKWLGFLDNQAADKFEGRELLQLSAFKVSVKCWFPE